MTSYNIKLVVILLERGAHRIDSHTAALMFVRHVMRKAHGFDPLVAGAAFVVSLEN